MSTRTGQKVVDKPPASSEILDVEKVDTTHNNNAFKDKHKKSKGKNLKVLNSESDESTDDSLYDDDVDIEKCPCNNSDTG